MAKKTFDSSIKNRHKDIKDTIETFDMEQETKDLLKNINEVSTKEDIIKVKNRIISDKVMSDGIKNEVVIKILGEFQEMFNFDNCPDDYNSLKEEAKFLSGMTQYSFLLMGQRLLKIKEKELYKEDGYPDFKSFIEGELTIAKTTVYCYMDIYNFFGVQTSELEEKIDYSKLFPVIPLLKSKNENIPKDEIKKEFIKKMKIESAREIKEEARELKVKYGLVREKEEVRLVDKIKSEIEKLSHDEKRELQEFMKKFESDN